MSAVKSRIWFVVENVVENFKLENERKDRILFVEYNLISYFIDSYANTRYTSVQWTKPVFFLSTSCFDLMRFS